jgi:hypothetical protein
MSILPQKNALVSVFLCMGNTGARERGGDEQAPERVRKNDTDNRVVTTGRARPQGERNVARAMRARNAWGKSPKICRPRPNPHTKKKPLTAQRPPAVRVVHGQHPQRRTQPVAVGSFAWISTRPNLGGCGEPASERGGENNKKPNEPYTLAPPGAHARA